MEYDRPYFDPRGQFAPYFTAIDRTAKAGSLRIWRRHRFSKMKALRDEAFIAVYRLKYRVPTLKRKG